MAGAKEKRIPKFNDRDDESFHLWRLRMDAVFENQDCMTIVNGSETLSENASADAVTEFEKKKKKGTALVVLALGDKPLKIVQKHSKEPSEMWNKLTARYAGKSTRKKLSLLNEVFSKTYESGDSMTDHIGDLELNFTKLDNAGQAINELMQVSVLLASIKDCEEYESTVVAIRTMDEEKATWDIVTTRLIDEYKERATSNKKSGKNNPLAANAMTQRKCYRCGRLGHIAAQCDRKRTDKGSRKNRRRPQHKKSNETFEKPRLALAKVPFTKRISTANNAAVRISEENFIVDSGATHHMCFKKELFSSLHKISNEIQLGDQTVVKSEYQGTDDLMTNTRKWIRLNNVLYAPSMSLNLISVPQLDIHRINLSFFDGMCQLIGADTKETIAKGVLQDDGLYVVDAIVLRNSHPNAMANSMTFTASPKVQFKENSEVINTVRSPTSVWHSRLGHVGESKVREMMRSANVDGINADDKHDVTLCKPCTMGKQSNNAHKGSLVSMCDSVGDVVFSDVCGPMPVESWGHAKYILLFIDCASRYIWISTLKKKSDVAAKTKSFIRMFKVIYELNIKKFHTDNGGEFVNKKMAQTLNDEGITHVLTAAYNPQSNGVVERMN